MSADLDDYLVRHAFVELRASQPSEPGVSVRSFENSDLCIQVFNEFGPDQYAKVSPAGRPAEGVFLNGLIAYFTADDAATRVPGIQFSWLKDNHASLVSFFSPSSEGTRERALFSKWLREFGLREQARLSALAQEARQNRRPWWKLW